MPPDGLSIDLETSGTTVKPLPDMPAIRDADLTVRMVGRHASVSLGRGTVDVAPGRKLNIADGVFDVPDVHPKPALATARFRVDGAVPAAVAFLSSDDMRDKVGMTLDPDSTRGTVSARVGRQSGGRAQRAARFLAAIPSRQSSPISPPTSWWTGARWKPSTLQVKAANDGYQVKGDVKINGAPASGRDRKEGRRERAAPAAGEARPRRARRRLGIDLGDSRDRRDPGQGLGRHRQRRQGRQAQRRCRSHPGQDRQHAAGLAQAGRQARACLLYAGQDAQDGALRQSGDYRLRRRRQRLGRVRRRRARSSRPICRISRFRAATMPR